VRSGFAVDSNQLLVCYDRGPEVGFLASLHYAVILNTSDGAPSSSLSSSCANPLTMANNIWTKPLALLIIPWCSGSLWIFPSIADVVSPTQPRRVFALLLSHRNSVT
ncbi:hypothetical protein BIW11_11063, partial [Tropilaelaps mercedesae]